MSSSVKDRHFWDIHSHILPRLDDGSQNWETTISMISLSEEAGVRTIVATPHYSPWDEPINPKLIRSLCKKAEAKYEEETGRKITILPGSELYFHSGLIADLEAGRAMTLNDTDTILVEFSTGTGFGALSRSLADLVSSGYRVILAHIERYECLRDMSDGVDKLIELGILLQSNISEVSGGFFDPTTRWLKKLYQARKISFTASDMHGTHHRTPMSLSEQQKLRRFVSEEYFDRLLFKNAEKFIGSKRNA